MTDLLALRFVYAFAPEDVRARTAFDLSNKSGDAKAGGHGALASL